MVIAGEIEVDEAGEFFFLEEDIVREQVAVNDALRQVGGPLKSIFLSFKNELIDEHKIFASEDIKKVNLFSRLIKSINYLIWGDV